MNCPLCKRLVFSFIFGIYKVWFCDHCCHLVHYERVWYDLPWHSHPVPKVPHERHDSQLPYSGRRQRLTWMSLCPLWHRVRMGSTNGTAHHRRRQVRWTAPQDLRLRFDADCWATVLNSWANREAHRTEHRWVEGVQMKRRWGRTRRNFRCRHHIQNRCNGGGNSIQNLLLMWKNREVLFHQLFGNRNILEAIELLSRIDRAKRHQKSWKGRGGIIAYVYVSPP